MYLPDLRRSERIDIAVAQMVIVRAHDDVFIGFAGQISQYVVYRGVEHLDLDVDA